MSEPSLCVTLVFAPDDQAWLRRDQIAVLRIAGRQFLVQGRAGGVDARGPVLRVFVGNAHAQTDPVFGRPGADSHRPDS